MRASTSVERDRLLHVAMPSTAQEFERDDKSVQLKAEAQFWGS
jgi:hypothetical protein